MGKSKKLLAVSNKEGKTFSIAGGSYRIVVSGKQTNGEFSVIEMTVPPGAGPAPHSHEDIDESFYVLEGEISFNSEKGGYLAQKDCFINIPKGGLVHSFKNNTNQTAKLLCTVMPAGLDDCFEEIANFIAKNPTASDVEKKEQISHITENYGNKLYPVNFLDK
jgi:quercetin dioxygenase-like cupin family protein